MKRHTTTNTLFPYTTLFRSLEVGRDPDELEAEAERVREQESAIAAEVESHRTTLEQAVTERRTAEEAAADEDRRQARSEEHTSELQSLRHLVCSLLLEKKN